MISLCAQFTLTYPQIIQFLCSMFTPGVILSRTDFFLSRRSGNPTFWAISSGLLMPKFTPILWEEAALEKSLKNAPVVSCKLDLKTDLSSKISPFLCQFCASSLGPSLLQTKHVRIFAWRILEKIVYFKQFFLRQPQLAIYMNLGTFSDMALRLVRLESDVGENTAGLETDMCKEGSIYESKIENSK